MNETVSETVFVDGSDVSDLNQAFMEQMRDRGDCVPLDVQAGASTAFMRTYEYPVNAWPFFVGPEALASLKDMNARILALSVKAIRAIFRNDPMALAEATGIDPVQCTFFMSGVCLDDICFRTDAILTLDGFKVVEANVGTSIGGWQIQWLEETFREHAQYRDFFTRHPVSCTNTPATFFRFLVDSAARGTRGEQLLILFMVGRSFNAQDYGDRLREWIDAAIAGAGARCEIRFITGFEDVEVDARGVWHRGRRAHMVTFGDVSAGQTPPIALLRSILAGKIACPDFPASGLLGDKRNLALLHHAADMGLLSGDDAGFVRRYVPRTFILGGALHSPATHQQVLSNKDMYVIKPCRGMQGADVHVGRYQTAQQWASIIADLPQPQHWIAQEHCESVQFPGHSGHPGQSTALFDVVWGVFQFGSRYGGAWLRMMPRSNDGHDGIINSARGAQERIVFEAPR
ncbi:hypothetical protein LDO31_08575 [Luteimonas sp. XNQY3]|nr:hypothetical protein [Luteimonas sp. XNQY3]MCD9006288.1 hypothetical protein [Luteimonas sp. XNQY3]